MLQPLLRKPDRSRVAPCGALVFAAALALGLVGCGTPSGSAAAAGGDAGAADGAGGAGRFWTNTARCDASAGVRSAVLAQLDSAGAGAGGEGTGPNADEVVLALVAAGYEAVTLTTDLGLDGGVAGADVRGDVAVWAPDGRFAVLSSCALDSLGQVHRLDDALRALSEALDASAVGAAGPADHAATTLRWARPVAIYGAKGRYWRLYVGDGLDINAPTFGALSLDEASAALGFAVAGASDPGGGVGDVVGLDSLVVGGEVVAEQDKRVVKGAAILRWPIAAALGAGEHEVMLDLMVADASLRRKLGVWTAYAEVLFASEGGAAPSLQGAGAGALRVSREVAALDLPVALTAVAAQAAGR